MNYEVIPPELAHKLAKAKVSIIGNNVVGDMVLANLVGLGVRQINYCGKRTSQKSPFVKNVNEVIDFFERLNPHLVIISEEESKRNADFYINVSSIEEERIKGDVFGTTHQKEGLISHSKLYANTAENISIGGIVAAICADEFRKTISPLSKFDDCSNTIKYAPKIMTENSNQHNDLKTMLIGAGGIGTFCALACAEYGFDTHIIDGDIYEDRNKNRQLFCETDKQKAETLADKINNNYNSKFTFSNKFVDENILQNIIKNKYETQMPDVIAGCVDNIETRSLLHEFCKRNDIKYIDGGLSATDGQVIINLNNNWNNNSPNDKQENSQNIVNKLQDKLAKDKHKENSCARSTNPSIIIPNCIIGIHLANTIAYAKKEILNYRFELNTFNPKRFGEKITYG